ncbi:hypothetical protein ACROYT_G031704 [Oculina patagonica]
MSTSRCLYGSSANFRRFLDTVTKPKNVARDKTGKATKHSLLLEQVFGYTTVSKIKYVATVETGKAMKNNLFIEKIFGYSYQVKYVATDMTGKAMKNEIFGYSCQVQECGKEMRS